MKKLDGVIDAQQFTQEDLKIIFSTSQEIERKEPEKKYGYLLNSYIMASLFYEPSTRTRLSFEAAMQRFGGRVISTENAKEFSSKAKGESLEDSIRVISEYCDVIVLRYYKEGGASRAQKYSHVPIINAGDGTGQHPTQALLDLYTIQKSFQEIRELKIAMVGDLINGRTVRSLAYFLAKHYSDNEIFFISPARTKMRQDIKDYLDRYHLKWSEHESFEEILPKLDVIYQTRVQRERFKDNQSVYQEVVAESEKLIIDQSKLDQMKPNAIIMHPLPRLLEISYDVDKDPRAKYFEQAKNGLFVRMALLKMILTGY